ncbi:MAG: hypothetical protein ABIR68_13395, partial [Ilumatobacteraceae bacterium]
HVAAKSNPAVKVTLEGGKLTAQTVGGDGPQQRATIARSSPTNILFDNKDAGKFRLTAFAGTAVETVNNTTIKTDRLSCTTLIRKDGQQMLTVVFPKSSAAVTDGKQYTLSVPGLDGQAITVDVP